MRVSLSWVIYFFYLFTGSDVFPVYVLLQKRRMCLLKLYHVTFPPVVLLLCRLMHVYTAMRSTPTSLTTSTSAI